MAASAWALYNKAKKLIGDGTIDLDTHTFKAVLCSSSSNAATLTIEDYTSLTNELATANGYTSGGLALTSVTWSESSGTVTFDSADITWNASGGSITARYCVIYDDTASPKKLLCYTLLDTAPADVTATAGTPFTLQLSASGIFRAT
jgi:hypothetical protein